MADVKTEADPEVVEHLRLMGCETMAEANQEVRKMMAQYSALTVQCVNDRVGRLERIQVHDVNEQLKHNGLTDSRLDAAAKKFSELRQEVGKNFQRVGIIEDFLSEQFPAFAQLIGKKP